MSNPCVEESVGPAAQRTMDNTQIVHIEGTASTRSQGQRLDEACTHLGSDPPVILPQVQYASSSLASPNPYDEESYRIMNGLSKIGSLPQEQLAGYSRSDSPSTVAEMPSDGSHSRHVSPAFSYLPRQGTNEQLSEIATSAEPRYPNQSLGPFNGQSTCSSKGTLARENTGISNRHPIRPVAPLAKRMRSSDEESAKMDKESVLMGKYRNALSPREQAIEEIKQMNKELTTHLKKRDQELKSKKEVPKKNPESNFEKLDAKRRRLDISGTTSELDGDSYQPHHFLPRPFQPQGTMLNTDCLASLAAVNGPSSHVSPVQYTEGPSNHYFYLSIGNSGHDGFSDGSRNFEGFKFYNCNIIVNNYPDTNDPARSSSDDSSAHSSRPNRIDRWAAAIPNLQHVPAIPQNSSPPRNVERLSRQFRGFSPVTPSPSEFAKGDISARTGDSLDEKASCLIW